MVKDAIKIFERFDKSGSAKVRKLLSGVINGRLSPAELIESIGDDETIIELFVVLGPDPYQRKLFLRGVA